MILIPIKNSVSFNVSIKCDVTNKHQMFTKVIMDQSGASVSHLMENYMRRAVKTVQLRCGRIVPVLLDCGEQNPRKVAMAMDPAQA